VGIHNVLEPAAHGKPIVTGPNISRFQEALTLRAAGALWTPERPEELMAAVRKFNPNAGEVARAYVEGSRGAAHKIASELLKRI
jgi:3-deoxy-D-manno-octulosonic-acid transferase